MRWIVNLLLILVAVVLQVGFFGASRPLGVIPNISLILATLAYLMLDRKEALWFALIISLLLDSLSGAYFGLMTALVFSCIVIAHLASIALGPKVLLPAMISVLGTGFIYFIISAVWLGIIQSSLRHLLLLLLSQLIVDGIFTAASYPLVKLILLISAIPSQRRLARG